MLLLKMHVKGTICSFQYKRTYFDDVSFSKKHVVFIKANVDAFQKSFAMRVIERLEICIVDVLL